MEPRSDPLRVKSAVRTLDVFELLALHPRGLTLSQVSSALSSPKSSLHALMAALVHRDYVRAAKTSAGPIYSLSPRLFELGSAYISGVDVVRDGQEVVRQLSADCNETVHLAGLEGSSVLYLSKEEGNQPMRMVSAVGKRFPAYATGVGKILLAGLSEAELSELLPPGASLPRMTPSTITDMAALRTELDRVRGDGYALDYEESTLGLCCVAAPVYDATHLVAALSISVPKVRFAEERTGELLELVGHSARSLSKRLGAGAYPQSIRPGTTKQL